MPNTWTRALQSVNFNFLFQFNEKFNGPRTNDLEIKLKVEKSETMDKSLKNLKNIINNFSGYFESNFIFFSFYFQNKKRY